MGKKSKMSKNPQWAGVHNLDSLDQMQTVEVDPESRERRHKDHPELWELRSDDPQTLLEGFENGIKIAGENGDFIGIPNKDETNTVTSYTYRTYGQVRDDAKKFGRFLEQAGLEPGTDIIGIFSINNYAYDVAILGGYYRNLTNCSLYDTLGEQAVQYICQQTEMKLIIVENLQKLKMLFNVDCSTVKQVVLMNSKPDEEIPTKEGVSVITWAEALKAGEEGSLNEARPTPDSLATLNYTSGTTGNPKGVMLTHRALMTSGVGIKEFMLCGKPLTPEDVWFSYLPLAHIFERAAHILFMTFGARWAYTGGDMTKVLAELGLVKPTIFGAVPRTLNKLYDKINAKLQEPGCVSGIKGMLLRKGMRSKRALLDQGIVTRDTFWDRKVLKLVQEQLGGRVHTIACGAAPINPEVKGFIREVTGVYFVEGYGQTENCAAGCGTMFANYCFEDGAIGVPMPYTGIKLADVSEMGYHAKEGKGEICFRGHNVMKGYYKDPEKTAEAIDSEGWLHTGDIGCWTENGQLKIIDRKKHIFKLAQGEYVAPERLEGVYTKSPMVDQMFVYGNSLQSYLVAVIVANEAEYAKLNKDKDALMKAINAFGKENKLKGFEMIRGCVVETEPFSVENGLLTPTQKAKRPVIQEKYKPALEALYVD